MKCIHCGQWLMRKRNRLSGKKGEWIHRGTSFVECSKFGVPPGRVATPYYTLYEEP